MPDKWFVWGFPGIGKSNLHTDFKSIDADCEQFKYSFLDGVPTDLHKVEEWDKIERNPNYPQNYLEFIHSTDADVVFLNCHLSLLENIDKEHLLVLYPSRDLKAEYLQRYVARGDHASYISYMDAVFEDMISAIEYGSFRKMEIKKANIYLQNLISGGRLMSQFITKKDLSSLLKDGIELNVYTPSAEHAMRSPEDLAQLLFEGKMDIDIDKLRDDVKQRKLVLEKEKAAAARRGGLSHDALREKIMQGIVNGTFSIHHGEVAPYSHGYEVTYPAGSHPPAHRWTCYCQLSEVADLIVKKIEADRQDKADFSSYTLHPLDIKEVLQAIEEKEKDKLTSFVEESKSGMKRGQYSSSVAHARHVHEGIALDGIIQGHFTGSYSTMTTSMENETMKTLVALKGFCLDCLDRLEHPHRAFAVEYLKSQGTDVSTPEKLQAWIRDNPEKCGYKVNRTRKAALSDQIENAALKATSNHNDMNQRSSDLIR